MKVAAIVPMRHSSERVKGKNYRNFNSKPLFYWVIKGLLEVKAIDVVYIDTDSDTIIDLSKKYFPTVKILRRPEELRDGLISMNDVLLNSLNQINEDVILQTHSTNPLISSKTFDSAINQFIDNYPNNDSLFSVTRLHTRLWNEDGTPLNHNPKVLLRTQDLPPLFEENSCIFIFSKEQFKKTLNRIGENPIMFSTPQIESVDIDEEADFIIAETLMKINYQV